MAENQDKNSLEEQDVKRDTLTTRQGHPVKDNQNIRTIGNRGPATLENYHFIEKFLILIEKRFRNVVHREELEHLGILKPMEKLEMSR